MSEMSDLTAADWAAMRARCDKATPGPWIAERIDETSWRSVARCDGIHPAHNHGDDMMCYEADPECLGDTEIVTTDSGVYGPKWPDAEFIAHARTDLPLALDRVAELEAALADRDATIARLREALDRVPIGTSNG